MHELSDSDFNGWLEAQVNGMGEFVRENAENTLPAMLHFLLWSEKDADRLEGGAALFETLPPSRDILLKMFEHLGRDIPPRVAAVLFVHIGLLLDRTEATRHVEAQEGEGDEIMFFAGLTADGRSNHALVRIDRDPENAQRLLWGLVEMHPWNPDKPEQPERNPLEYFFKGQQDQLSGVGGSHGHSVN